MTDRPRILDRVHVTRLRLLGRPSWAPRPWRVWHRSVLVSTHATHAEAITAATELARTETP